MEAACQSTSWAVGLAVSPDGSFLVGWKTAGEDSDGAGPSAGPDPGPPFPGQDFVDPAIDLTSNGTGTEHSILREGEVPEGNSSDMSARRTVAPGSETVRGLAVTARRAMLRNPRAAPRLRSPLPCVGRLARGVAVDAAQ